MSPSRPLLPSTRLKDCPSLLIQMPAYHTLRDRHGVPQRICTEQSRVQDCPSRALNHGYLSRNDTHAHAGSCGVEEITRTTHDSHSPRQFIPYLYLFSPPTPGSTLTGSWTHTLRLLPASKARPAGSTDLVGDGVRGPQGLNLYLTTAAFKGDGELNLSSEHLLLARDFLALALPYYASAHPSSPVSITSSWSSASSPISSGGPFTPLSHLPLEGLTGMHVGPSASVQQNSQADPVRVLVLGPPRVILAIGLTYIAYASGCDVARVIRGVLEDDCEAEWCRRLLEDDGRMGMSDKEMKTLERVAMQEM
ncbi:hypothetical protein B0H11DRAFT_2068893 [Mycena galericulata]|nr:hypothetical protein B0H11DRAFT_2068893 [Mycena galericulata]